MPRTKSRIGRQGRRALRQRGHALRRCYERYGLVLSHSDYEKLVRQIQRGEGKFLGRQSGRVTHWLVQHNGQDLRAVYDKSRQTIATFLPCDHALAESEAEN